MIAALTARAWFATGLTVAGTTIQAHGGRSPARIETRVTRGGLELSAWMRAATYPRGALVAVHLRVRNVSTHGVTIDGNVIPCGLQNPRVAVVDGRGRTVYPPILPRLFQPPCRIPNPQPIAASLTVRSTVLAVLRGRSVRATVSASERSVTTPPLRLGLRPSRQRRLEVHESARGAYVDITRPAGATGPMYYVSSAKCAGGAETAYSNTLTWKATTSARVYSGCLTTTGWYALVG